MRFTVVRSTRRKYGYSIKAPAEVHRGQRDRAIRSAGTNASRMPNVAAMN